MNLDISKNSEQFIRSQVRSGRYSSEDQVVEEALQLLKQRGSDPAARTPQTEEEFQRSLLEMGLMTQLPEAGDDEDDPDDQPIPIQGEPLSKTVICERR